MVLHLCETVISRKSLPKLGLLDLSGLSITQESLSALATQLETEDSCGKLQALIIRSCPSLTRPMDGLQRLSHVLIGGGAPALKTLDLRGSVAEGDINRQGAAELEKLKVERKLLSVLLFASEEDSDESDDEDEEEGDFDDDGLEEDDEEEEDDLQDHGQNQDQVGMPEITSAYNEDFSCTCAGDTFARVF